jgi:hypothetical protein
MLEKKKTEIIIGFEEHTKKYLGKATPDMKKADVIFLEMEPEFFRSIFLNKQITPEEALNNKKLLKGVAAYDKRELSILRNLWKDGKSIASWDVGKNSVKKYPSLTRAINLREFAINQANSLRKRDELGAATITKYLPNFEGKTIYVRAGAMHTGLYHQLKKELEPRGVSVKATFLTKGKYGNGGTSIKYTPLEELIRIFRFNTKSARNKERIKSLIDEHYRHQQDVFNLVKKYKNEGLNEDRAIRKASVELVRKRTGRGSRR